jgi:hypothetical protein
MFSLPYTALLLVAFLLFVILCCDCYIITPTGSRVQKRQHKLFNRIKTHTESTDATNDDVKGTLSIGSAQTKQFTMSRPELFNRLLRSGIAASASLFMIADIVHAESGSTTDEILDAIKQAKNQLGPVPDLIKKEQWDSVRAILIKPPLSDCWTKTSKKSSLLQQYAENVASDELEALEIKEEIQGHLRYLDMAVYNNVFNPIGSTGTIGATKELIRSYYEDPINEYKACIKFFDELIELSAK